MTYSVGIIGAGNISETHARAAAAIPGVRVVAVYGENRERVSVLAAQHHAEPYHALDAFLAHRPMDVVAIGSPSGLHAAHGVAAAARGLHVLVEKPIDVTTEQADRLIAAADEAGVTLGVFFQDRFKPDLVRLKQLLDGGRLGRPLLVNALVPWYRPAEYYSRSRWRGTWALDGGGALMNQGIHTVDLLLWLFGDVRRVQSMTTTALHAIEVEDTAVALLDFENGAVGVLAATTAAYPGYPRHVQVTGSMGSAVVDHDRLSAIDVLEPGDDVAMAAPAGIAESASSPVVSDIAAHRAVFEDFFEAIRTGRSPRCDGREARRSVDLVQAIYAAARRR